MLERNESAVKDKVIEIVGRMLAKRSIQRQVTIDDDLRDIGLTSLDMVNLMLAVEGEFDLRIPEDDMTPANFRSVAMIDNLVKGLKIAA
jgi:acyl carrier protein